MTWVFFIIVGVASCTTVFSACDPAPGGEKPRQPGAGGDPWEERFATSEFVLASQLADVPASVRSFLEERCREQLASAGQPFNPTDVVDDRLPMRRLILTGTAPSLVFVWYEHGGRSLHQHLLLFDLAHGEPRLVYHARPLLPSSSLAELTARIEERTLPNDVDSNDEF